MKEGGCSANRFDFPRLSCRREAIGPEEERRSGSRARKEEPSQKMTRGAGPEEEKRAPVMLIAIGSL